MGEHLDAHRIARRAADLLLVDRAGDAADLIERQFARQHHHVGPLREEFHRLAVREVALRGDMHLHPDAARVEDRRQVGSDHGVDPRHAGAVDERVHLPQLVLVDHRIDRQVALHPRRTGDPDDTFQIVRREIRGRLRPHVELPHTEIDGVGSGLYGRLQRLVAPGRSHQFYVASFHLECFSRVAALFRQRSASQAVHPSRTTDCNPLRLVRFRPPRPNREFFRKIESSISCVPSGCGRTRAAAPCAHRGRSARRASPAHGRNAAKSAAP